MRTVTSFLFCAPVFFLSGLVSLFSQDAVRPAGSGFGNLRLGQDCYLGQIYDSENNQLLFRQMGGDGEWSQGEVIDSGFTPGDAALFQVNRGDGLRWEALYLKGNTRISHAVRESSGEWTPSSSYVVSDGFYFDDALLAAELDGDGVFHLAFLSAESAPQLYYIRLEGTDWQKEPVATFTGRTQMEGFDSPHNLAPPRMLSLALGPDGRVHLVVSAEQVSQPVSGGTRVQSDLFYFVRGQSWSDREVLIAGGSSDDAGLGASLDVAPDGTVAVASTYLPRASTGSPGRASLLYSVMQENGNWETETVANRADGYFSHDGERGTGLYPVLQFDAQSQPHIAFSDHASEHAQGTAWSYAGQVRHATRAAESGTWLLRTLVSQPTNDAFLRRAAPPVLAIGGSHCPDLLAVFADHSDFDEPTFTWNHFEFFQVEGDLSTTGVWFAAASEIEPEGWRYFDWFKGFKPDGENWIFHGRHGWLYVQAEDTNRMFFWDVALGRWLFTNESIYPWMYAYGGDEGWVFFFEGGRPGSRFFSRGDTGAIVSEFEFSTEISL